MANGSFKTLRGNDIVSTRTLLHEAIPLTGTIVSGTYADANIKKHSHGMFESVYDYPFLSSSANHIFDLTVGISANSGLYPQLTAQKKKKKNVYGQMAQVLVGYDKNGTVLDFDADGNILAGGDKLREVFIMPMSRLLVKDEIKKGTFSLELGISSSFSQAGQVHTQRIKITDHNAANSYFVNSPAGEYGILYAENVGGGSYLATTGSTKLSCGLLYYQAGIAIITASVFISEVSGGLLKNTHGDVSCSGPNGILNDINQSLIGNLITGSVDNFRTRLYNLSFNNTTELNSTIYFCRVRHDEFNYSANQTYLSGSKIRVKDTATSDPIAYITTIGLYSSANELMAVAKLSEPLKKTPSQEFTLRVRLDY